MSQENTGPLDRLIETIEASNRFPMVYIHGSKINGVIQCFRKIPNLIRQNPGKIANYGMSAVHMRAVQDILSYITQIQDLSFQCSKDMCVQFLLATSIQKPMEEISAMVIQLYKDFMTLEVPTVAELFKTFYDEIEQTNLVDMKRIALVLDQIKKKNREDAKENLAKRFNSLKKIGISADDTSENVAIPDLPSNLKIIINRDDFILGKSIGTGVSGNVYLGKNKNTGEEVAVKILHKKQLSGSELESYQREVYALSVLVHPCILKFCGYTEDPPYYILTEYMANGCLFDILRKRPQILTPTIRSLIALDIARGLEYLHSKGVIHRDMKSLNILIDNNYRARICDFGFVRSKNQATPMTGLIGTAHWMAPEVLLSSPNYDEKVDVYSYAILLWELLTNEPPFSGMNPSQITDLVINQGYRPPIPDNAPPNLTKLINKCWQTDPTKRLSMSKVVRYLFDPSYHFTGTDEAAFEAAAGPKPKSQFDLSIAASSLQNRNSSSNFGVKQTTNKAFLNASSGPSNDELVRKLSTQNDRENTLKQIFQKIDQTNDTSLVEKCMPYFTSIFENQDPSLPTLLQCLANSNCEAVFDVSIMKSLLAFSSSDSKELCELALLASVKAATVRLNYIASSAPNFLTQMHSFIKKPLSEAASVSLFRVTTQIVENISTEPPDRLYTILFWSVTKRTTTQTKKEAINSLAASMRLVQVRNSVVSFDSWFFDPDLTPVCISYAKYPEPARNDQSFYFALFNCAQSNPSKNIVEIAATLLHNEERFSKYLQKEVFSPEFFTFLVKSREIPEIFFRRRELYNAFAHLLNVYPEIVCEILKTQDVDSKLILKSHLPSKLSDKLLSCNDESLSILLMAAIYGAACPDDSYLSILSYLSKAVYGQNISLRAPAFLCIAKLLHYFSSKFDAAELMPAAAYYVNSDNRTTRRAAARLLKEHLTEPSVDLVRSATIFVENFSQPDECTKEAVEAFGVAAQSKGLDKDLRTKLSAIYQKTH
ncbi:TKL family protein kinase [Trichomonas vaginalis G3]|uniref:TKL family protein kinase n=1 Tax=Trichomonas vaginalis (strain ATCC PRA-98 / G3) TaxID=412133 RepID=A2DAP2_TRIV3|nr:protein kinase protein [Trichomonas vaginalis G3]EAY22545.1 TKL family protein kinase [Trichomonas vaginalis G3]KAI5497278.1 protein kinase protein [Trichomonas vaginalis G3]|eukprot:XP_001583531.1 TKL family protein kinase [Trichomonas vaginalis G3]